MPGNVTLSFYMKKNILHTAYPRCKNKTESYIKDLKRVLTLPFTNAFIYHKLPYSFKISNFTLEKVRLQIFIGIKRVKECYSYQRPYTIKRDPPRP